MCHRQSHNQKSLHLQQALHYKFAMANIYNFDKHCSHVDCGCLLMFCNFDPSSLLRVQLDSLWPLLWLHFNLLQLWLWLQLNLLQFTLQLQFDFLQSQCNYIQLLQLQLCFIFKMALQSTITTLPKLLWILKIKVCVLFLQNWRYKLHTLQELINCDLLICKIVLQKKKKNQEGKKCHYCKAHKMEKDWGKNIKNINNIKHIEY